MILRVSSLVDHDVIHVSIGVQIGSRDFVPPTKRSAEPDRLGDGLKLLLKRKMIASVKEVFLSAMATH